MGKRTDVDDSDWSARDDALWMTAELALLMHQGRLKQRQAVPVPFAMQHSQDEAPLAFGPFRLSSYEAWGDGSYVHDSSFVVARGRGAVPLMLGLGAAAALGNAGRRRRAAALAQPRWTPIDSGTVTVSDYGFYLHTQTSVLPRRWNSIQMATLIGPGALQVMGRSTSGSVNWILESDWAELVFLFWATVRCPGHEQLQGRTWLPDEWVTKAFVHSQQGAGHPDPEAFRAISRGLGMGFQQHT
ncbi:hypothetical protein [Arthrobacter sp. NPDC092385]|uniref:hypothetical protein n=1 Tax=Arthrobacter sp. NPDC092385 TaxID=3363943 RepID=UPI00380192B8